MELETRINQRSNSLDLYDGLWKEMTDISMHINLDGHIFS